ncbi:arginine-tRNA-protein transferase 1 [Xylona heveae TC161]|uniref:arginyltransferase n=1 Tax=Xylona heveae (strain CBS 132557 / TC161) TaxID=1328760 RepID=A0A165A6J8_XYLHT|nr:arginine-tRNA-protein transferase 1 [Xylona heveae TC161]KZF20022.1 arginine-tRNA-protein transferase 1 [Xylona heveae TC161]
MAEKGLSSIAALGYMNNRCGYCKRTDDGSPSYFVFCRSLTTDDYIDLMNRGWRRSGTYIYKPDVLHACCPHYTIRLDAQQFKPAKDQRQALNRWSKHILGEKYIHEAARLHPVSKEEKSRRKNEFDLVHSLHECESANVKRPPQPEHTFEVTLEPDTFTEEKYALYANYQRIVHREEPKSITRKGFKGFLCSSPLVREERNVSGRPQKLGSYHQCYRVDGRLVAMGVLDLLPDCVSAVYFMYFEDLNQWNFGKLGALRETALAVEGGYKYYYMGFYIHSCIKMRYKADYRPQYILDPETFAWTPLDDDMKKRLETRRYVSRSRDQRMGFDANTTPEEAGVKRIPGTEEHETSDETAPPSGKKRKTRPPKREKSLFKVKMPGVMAPEEVEASLDLGDMLLQTHIVPYPVPARYLVSWERGTASDTTSMKGAFAQVAAVLGPNVAKRVVMAMPPPTSDDYDEDDDEEDEEEEED